MSTETQTAPSIKMSQTPTITSDKPDLLPKSSQYNLRGGIPNSALAVSVISAILGGLLCSSVALAVTPVIQQYSGGGWSWARPQLGVYLACMGLFHLSEFWTTAGWNPQKLSVDGESTLCFDINLSWALR